MMEKFSGHITSLLRTLSLYAILSKLPSTRVAAYAALVVYLRLVNIQPLSVSFESLVLKD